MATLNELALHCRVEGYRLGLAGEWCFVSSNVDRALAQANGMSYDVDYHPYGYYSDEFQMFLRAMTAGIHDGYLAYAKESGFFLSPEQAAKTKGVATNTIYRLLRNEKRVDQYFGRSPCDGDGKRRVWYLHPDDVKDWQPAPQGRKRNEDDTQ